MKKLKKTKLKIVVPCPQKGTKRREIDGALLSEQLAVHRHLAFRKHYVITHINSGLTMGPTRYLRQKDALEVLHFMEERFDWSKVRSEEDFKEDMAHKVSKLLRAILEFVPHE